MYMLMAIYNGQSTIYTVTQSALAMVGLNQTVAKCTNEGYAFVRNPSSRSDGLSLYYQTRCYLNGQPLCALPLRCGIGVRP